MLSFHCYFDVVALFFYFGVMPSLGSQFAFLVAFLVVDAHNVFLSSEYREKHCNLRILIENNKFKKKEENHLVDKQTKDGIRKGASGRYWMLRWNLRPIRRILFMETVANTSGELWIQIQNREQKVIFCRESPTTVEIDIKKITHARELITRTSSFTTFSATPAYSSKCHSAKTNIFKDSVYF